MARARHLVELVLEAAAPGPRARRLHLGLLPPLAPGTHPPPRPLGQSSDVQIFSTWVPAGSWPATVQCNGPYKTHGSGALSELAADAAGTMAQATDVAGLSGALGDATGVGRGGVWELKNHISSGLVSALRWLACQRSAR